MEIVAAHLMAYLSDKKMSLVRNFHVLRASSTQFAREHMMETLMDKLNEKEKVDEKKNELGSEKEKSYFDMRANV